MSNVKQLSDKLASAIDQREERLFRSLDYDNDRAILPRDFEQVLAEVGLARDDQRIRESISALEGYAEAALPTEELETRVRIPRDQFCQAIRHNILLVERALQGRMVIPDFRGFCDSVTDIYEETRQVRDGAPADYIPQLKVEGPEAERYGVALCTIDGQRFAQGDAEHFFTVQSTSKAISYCLALEEHGPEAVHHAIGHEPSGKSFNELGLDKANRPHNPMINAGGIMSCALIGLTEKRRLMSQGAAEGLDLRGWSGRRFDSVMAHWQALCGGELPRFSTSVFLSERETADRNFAQAYYMREKNAFPEGADLHDVLEFYTQCCAIELNARMMSVIAATLANGGICAVTGKRVLSTETVRNCLSMMSSSGMYDYSGEFAFTIGLPAKSGVSGVIMIVVPNVMGICTWSPRLDTHGNSVRGLAFCRRLVESFNFHNYDNLTGNSTKRDPRLNPMQLKARRVNEMIWAASKGDLGAMQDQARRGADLACKDYDLRTPLHLAAAENQLDVVEFYIAQAPRSLSPKDRWGGTPLDDAALQGHAETIALLERAGARRGQTTSAPSDVGQRPATTAVIDSPKTDELIWAASQGDLAAIRRLVAQGVSLESADYDQRTAMHLAAAEGRSEVVRVFIAHGVAVNPRDRWNNTPLDDAIRHGRAEVVALLQANGGTCRSKTERAPSKAA
ncbi:MAG: glutaminase A [Pseudomonadota bacterium]